METQIRIGCQADVMHLSDLLKEHWDEVAKNKEVMVLNPDKQAYEALEKAGMFFTLVAYRDEEVIGYSGNILYHHLHYKDLFYCLNDVLFVKKEYRNTTSAGLKLIKETEQTARALGAKLMIWHAKEQTTLAALLPRMKYNVQEVSFSKIL